MMKLLILRFLNKPHSDDGLFFTNLRSTFQNIKKLRCKHKWLKYINAPETTSYLRICAKCGIEQKMRCKYVVNDKFAGYEYTWYRIDIL